MKRKRGENQFFVFYFLNFFQIFSKCNFKKQLKTCRLDFNIWVLMKSFHRMYPKFNKCLVKFCWNLLIRKVDSSMLYVWKTCLSFGDFFNPAYYYLVQKCCFLAFACFKFCYLNVHEWNTFVITKTMKVTQKIWRNKASAGKSPTLPYNLWYWNNLYHSMHNFLIIMTL